VYYDIVSSRGGLPPGGYDGVGNPGGDGGGRRLRGRRRDRSPR